MEPHIPPLFLQAEASRPAWDLWSFLHAHGHIVLVAALGAAAIYLLLPRPRRYPALYGVASGIAALLLGAWTLLRAEPVWVETILFNAFAGLAILSGAVMITQTQPVRAALSFALVVLSTCGLFMLQAAPFLTAATISIYAGAIVVTFLFVIMLAQQSGLGSADHRSREPLLACLAGFILLAALIYVLQTNYREASDAANLPDEEITRLTQQSDRNLMAVKVLAGAQDGRSLKEKKEALDKRIDDVLKQFRHYAETVKKKYPRLNESCKKLRTASDDVFSSWDGDDDKRLRGALSSLLNAGESIVEKLRELQDRQSAELRGSLLAARKLKLSSFSGTPANRSPKRDATGRPKMPADNVAALGRSLFTDYLVAVELAATLLLVATIGAIAIAGRRSEKLR